MDRAERRRRTINKYNSRAKLFYQIDNGIVIKVSADEAYPHDRCFAGTKTTGDTHWHKAESWVDAKNRSNWIHLYKNTGTIYDRSYWTKYERRRLNKQSRRNAKLDIMHGEEVAFERTSLK